MRHKQVLDAAAENPGASMAELADQVPSATTDLVEHVLEKYGDPADEEATSDQESEPGSTLDALNGSGVSRDESNKPTPDATDGPTEGTVPMTVDGEDDAGREYPAPGELTNRQLETLRAIAADPNGSQREVAAELGVSAATVSNRVNSIEGFDWSDRGTFAEAVLAGDGSETAGPEDGSGRAGEPAGDGNPSEVGAVSDSGADAPEAVGADAELVESIERLTERVGSIGRRLDSLSDSGSTTGVRIDTELAPKVVHACLESDAISREEEIRILRRLFS